tara:strand:- start:6207 stop:7604 length:1398 start_codon:yes stop_codon:yes gene_type:complete
MYFSILFFKLIQGDVLKKIICFFLVYIFNAWAYSKSIEEYQFVAEDIIDIAIADSTAYKRLGYLCDTFGPRLSGSKNLEQAINWIIKTMKEDGLSNVEGQYVKVPAYIRGKESARLLKPFKKELNILAIGGSVSTPKGGITSRVIVVNDSLELEKKKRQVRGNIVLFNMPFTTYGETVSYRYNGASIAAKYGARASLIRSVADWSMDTPHTGTMRYKKSIKKIPHAALTIEDALMIGRIYDRGNPVVLRLELESKMVPDRLSRNIIAEIKGSIYPDEIIVIGGHIDSWDVGQGAHDDGGGCVASWQALNIIKGLGLRPKRTIRCVLWTNEENGGRGSRSYADTYSKDLDNHVVAIESDNGVFNPKGFGFTGSKEAKAVVSSIAKLLAPIDAAKITDGGRAADIIPLNNRGVPAMSLKVDNSRYFWYHHTNADTFDKIDFNSFNKCVAAMTVMAYVLADLDDPLSR